VSDIWYYADQRGQIGPLTLLEMKATFASLRVRRKYSFGAMVSPIGKEQATYPNLGHKWWSLHRCQLGIPTNNN